ncbi:MAG: DUF559 domain-containing protein, partial [Myxococcales bacterium]
DGHRVGRPADQPRARAGDERLPLSRLAPSGRPLLENDGPVHVHRRAYDERRDRVMVTRGLRVVRLSNDEVLRGPRACLQRVLAQARLTGSGGVASAVERREPGLGDGREVVLADGRALGGALGGAEGVDDAADRDTLVEHGEGVVAERLDGVRRAVEGDGLGGEIGDRG